MKPQFGGISQVAFTLLELLASICIIGTLVALSFPAYGRFKSKAHQAACVSNLRALHGAFAAAIQDQGHWPQPPLEEGEWDENRYFKWWVTEMEKYGASENTWRCPADKTRLEMEQQISSDKDFFSGSYVPSHFDKIPSSPFRYNQPWVVERGGNHGKGGHVLMPDGSVDVRSNPFVGR
jgi:type II secretory pathway pseudopilin PulG